MNDILKSQTVIDRGAGQVLGIDYATPQSIEGRLAGWSVRLHDNRSLRDLLAGLRGRRILSYRERDDSGQRHAQAICHFFLDDYRFENVWSKPDWGLSHVRRFRAVLTPDFSLYADWPLIVQQWNHYRRQWLGRYWQDHGVKVIPTVNWSTPDSYAWCFTGIPPGQTVALAVPDLRKPDVRQRFNTGYQAMQDALRPAHLLIYGHLPPERHTLQVREFPPDWQRLRGRDAGRGTGQGTDRS